MNKNDKKPEVKKVVLKVKTLEPKTTPAIHLSRGKLGVVADY